MEVQTSTGGQEILVVRTHGRNDRFLHCGSVGVFSGQLSLPTNGGSLVVAERDWGAGNLPMDQLLPEKICAHRKTRRGDLTAVMLSNYQQVAQSQNCIYQGDCAIVFPKTDHITTAITAVSCFFTLPPGTTVVYASMGSQTASPRFYLQPFAYGYSSGSITYGSRPTAHRHLLGGSSSHIIVVHH
jgi:hypothetical protein